MFRLRTQASNSTQFPANSGEQASWLVDLLLFLFLAALLFGVVEFGMQWLSPAEPMRQKPLVIDLSPWALPVYSLKSLARGFLAYLFSLLFTLVYGSIAAKRPRAERVMIPILDILQGIPVLGFLPGLVLGLVALFPRSNFGLELACIIMIFTGQAWNMTYSFYGSVRSVPVELREVARLHNFGVFKTFRTVEAPFSMIGLVMNSMMSMAGGWFFLTTTEAFRLGDKDFRLPGIGSYMSMAIDTGDRAAQLYAVIAMGLMIVATDWLLWRPLSVWSERFKSEEIAGEREESFILSLLHRSRLLAKLRALLRSRQSGSVRRKLAEVQKDEGVSIGASAHALQPRWERWLPTAGWVAAVVFSGLAFLGGVKLIGLISHLTLSDWSSVLMALFGTFARTTTAVLLGALWTVPAGIVIGRSRKLSRKLSAAVQVIASFPAPMLFPLVTMGVLWLGIDFKYGCTVLMMLGSQWYILFNVIAGAQGMPGDLREIAKMYGIKGWALWRTLYLPAIFPSLVTGLVTAAGGAWNASIVAEFVHFKDQTLVAPGLGSLITKATEEANFPLLCAGVMTMSFALVLINRVFWKRLYAKAVSRYMLTGKS